MTGIREFWVSTTKRLEIGQRMLRNSFRKQLDYRDFGVLFVME